jgi:3-oxoacyl-[acyl-carrier protein] reductase
VGEMMSNQYKDQAVLITGAGHGIGLQIALAFANEGALVGVNDIKNDLAMETVSKITTSGGNAIALPADVRSATQVEEIVSKMAGDFGRIDILVNNAGIYPNSLIVEMTEDEWDRVWDINMKGMFLVSRSVARQMIDAEQRGKIVNISSSAALRARVGASHYCSSKAAISMFTKVLALELADYKINVNAVAPGLIEVPDWDISPEYIKSMVNITPWGRIGKPEDVSNVVLFLASEEADFMTGSIVFVDGGVAVGQNLPPS